MKGKKKRKIETPWHRVLFIVNYIKKYFSTVKKIKINCFYNYKISVGIEIYCINNDKNMQYNL